MYTIYVITNLVNGKVYVGQTTKTGKERFQSHWWSRGKKDYFHYALNKHKREDWTVQDITVFETREEVNNAEKLWILLLRSSEKKLGYNSTLGGEYGAIPNEETRAKIGAASSQRTPTLETRQRMSEAHSGEKNHFFGKKHDPEMIEATKKVLSEKLSGEGNYWFGKQLSPEHKAKLSLVRKGKKQKPRSEEACKKLSVAATARWARWRAEKAAKSLAA